MAIPETLAKSIAANTSSTSGNTAPSLKWVDPTYKNLSELQAVGDPTANKISAIVTGIASSNSRSGSSMFGSVDSVRAAKRAVFDTKAMGLPDGFEVSFADTNPYTGEYSDPNKLRLSKQIVGGGYVNYDAFKQSDGSLKLSKPWVDAPTGTMRDFWSKVITGASIIFPGLGQGIGAALGASGTTASAVGGAVLGGASAKVAGADTGGVLKSAVAGGVGGSVGGVTNTLVDAGLNPTVANVAARTGTGAVGAIIKGGNPLVGALLANLRVNTGNQQINPILNLLLKNYATRQLVPPKRGP